MVHYFLKIGKKDLRQKFLIRRQKFLIRVTPLQNVYDPLMQKSFTCTKGTGMERQKLLHHL